MLVFLFFRLQKLISCWKIFPSIHYCLASSSVSKCWPLLHLGNMRVHGNENNIEMARGLGIFALLNQTTAKSVPSSIHDLITEFFATFLTEHAKLITVTLYIEYSEVLVLPLI